MRNPPGDGADQRSTRRRDRGSDSAGRGDNTGRGDGSGRGGAAGRAGIGGQRDAGARAGVFAPGYDAGRPEQADRPVADARASGPSSTWYASTAGGAAGKGPVRGYPPVPGQPPPMYPPGQFAAWNRGLGAARQGGQGDGLPERGRADTDQAGPNPAGPLLAGGGQAGGSRASSRQVGTAQPGPGRMGAEAAGWAEAGPQSGPGGGPGGPGPETGRAPGSAPHAQPDWQSGPAGDSAAGSRYYAQDLGPGAEPGYPMLAVSDPAADVTSTQTWRAVGDGRTTGVWTAPVRPAGDPAARPGRASDVVTPSAAWPVPSTAEAEPRSWPDRDRTAGRHGPAAGKDTDGTPAGSPGATTVAPRPQPGSDSEGRAGDRIAEPGRRAARGHSGAHTSPHQVQRSQRRGQGQAGPDEPQSAAGPRLPAGPQPPGGPQATAGPHRPVGARRSAGSQRAAGAPRRKRPASVTLAIATALVLVLTAVAALSYAVFRGSPKPKPNAAASTRPTTSPTASSSPSPSLGPYGHIGTRTADPQPLTVAELYPATFTAGGATIVLTASNRSTKCTSNVVGAKIQSAVGRAGCDQAVRATYLSSASGLMGTVGVLNLSTAKGAKTAASSADASDFIRQLTGKTGATRKIGRGTGIEEAAAKGHYLILIWAEFTTLRKPKTAAQRAEVVQFMTELLQNTANLSLTNRMLTGTP